MPQDGKEFFVINEEFLKSFCINTFDEYLSLNVEFYNEYNRYVPFCTKEFNESCPITFGKKPDLDYVKNSNNSNLIILNADYNQFENNIVLNYFVKKSGTIKIRLYDLQGELIYNGINNNNKLGNNESKLRLQSNSLSNGVYIINV